MMRIAVTGSAGYLGRAVLRALEQDPQVEWVVGIDLTPCPESDRTRFYRVDVRDPGLADVLRAERINAVMHLAFIIEARGDPALMRDVNVGGTANVLRAAAAAGVDSFLLMSSLTVYGAWPDNPPLLTEDLVPRPNPDDLYGQHKLQVEWLCHQFAAAHPEVSVAMMRPCGIIGPNFDTPFIKAMREATFLPLPQQCRGAAQFIHEDDAAQLALLLVRERARGIYNAAHPETLPWRNVYERLGKPIISLPWGVLNAVFRLLWSLGKFPVLPTQMSIMTCPLVISGERAERELGFRPRYSSSAALEAALRRA